jgi:hypothetical protein
VREREKERERERKEERERKLTSFKHSASPKRKYFDIGKGKIGKAKKGESKRWKLNE